MPQMKPMHWVFMLFLTSMLLIITASSLFYSSYPFIMRTKLTSPLHYKFMWNWKW